jgi:L-asparaginase
MRSQLSQGTPMLTLVVHLRRTPEALARVVLTLRRLRTPIDSLMATRAEFPDVTRLWVRIDADSEHASRIEANLYKLIDVLLVEQWELTPRWPLGATKEVGWEPLKVTYLITTGGTIEKMYSEATGAVGNLDSKIDRYLQRLRLPGTEIRVVPLVNKDSLEMTDSDRRLILGTVMARLSENAPIVITHGTDTLVGTGLFLQHEIANVNVPIVLTGAMVPLGFDGSDALQNLTESLFAARLLNPGIYVVIHGEVFPIYRVRKDRAAGRFVSTDEHLM